MAQRGMTSREERNLLRSDVGRKAYLMIVGGWSAARIKKVMRTKCDLQRERNNILYSELQRRRNARTN
jgi:hypothetical protein